AKSRWIRSIIDEEFNPKIRVGMRSKAGTLERTVNRGPPAGSRHCSRKEWRRILKNERTTQPNSQSRIGENRIGENGVIGDVRSIEEEHPISAEYGISAVESDYIRSEE